MATSKADKTFFSFIEAANKLAKTTEADAILVLLEQTTDWAKLKRKATNSNLLIATLLDEVAEKTEEFEIPTVKLETPEASVADRLTQSVLEFVAQEQVRPGSSVVAVYSSFDSDMIDTISVLKLTERLGRLTARDLKKLETKVPLETLKVVVDLAVEIGREGREGKPVGTMFVVGDHRRVIEESRPAGFDAVKGYTRKERNLLDSKIREAIKEIAQLDGMFVVSADGTVESSARIIDTAPVEITMTTGLGSRHFCRSGNQQKHEGYRGCGQPIQRHRSHLSKWPGRSSYRADATGDEVERLGRGAQRRGEEGREINQLPEEMLNLQCLLYSQPTSPICTSPKVQQIRLSL